MPLEAEQRTQVEVGQHIPAQAGAPDRHSLVDEVAAGTRVEADKLQELELELPEEEGTLAEGGRQAARQEAVEPEADKRPAAAAAEGNLVAGAGAGVARAAGEPAACTSLSALGLVFFYLLRRLCRVHCARELPMCR